ncbi:hypothetical protein ABIE65_005040 [Constrictibacter sp. MBR-5]|jgi:hypothetical protein|uniref:hypothetical protein n=1 Tax=Constrictibacter sp. MBR-5 TaxID=3156467 RepID=UPI0033925285
MQDEIGAGLALLQTAVLIGIFFRLGKLTEAGEAIRARVRRLEEWAEAHVLGFHKGG